jgi:hypothetical protein
MTSLGQLLYGDVDETARGQSMEESLRDLAVVTAAAALVPGVLPEIAGALSTMLNAPVGNLALRGWRKHRDVLDALRDTQESGDRQVVRLARHKMSSKQSPSVDVVANGVNQTVLELDLKVDLEVSMVEMTIENGAIIDTSPGPTKAKASLSASGQTIVKRELTVIDLSFEEEATPRPATPPPPGPTPPPPTGPMGER